jgi:hypothetical protein
MLSFASSLLIPGPPDDKELVSSEPVLCKGTNESLSTVKKQTQPPTPKILPQSRSQPQPIQCWAHTKSGKRCRTIVTSREGEPVPVPYCNVHLKSGDGALKVAPHPFAGHCLVANCDLPKNYRMAFYGNRGRCATSDKEDRSISFYPPNPETGRNFYPRTRVLKQDNYNGVLNPKDTGDVLQYASCPGPSERQNIRYVLFN